MSIMTDQVVSKRADVPAISCPSSVSLANEQLASPRRGAAELRVNNARSIGSMRAWVHVIVPIWGALGLMIAAAPEAFAQPAPPSPSGSSSSVVPAASSSVPASDPRKDEARELLRRGLALYRAGSPQKALDQFLASRKLYPANSNTINAANCLRDLGAIDEALEMYEEAVASFSSTFDDDDRRTVPAIIAELRASLGSLFVSANTTGVVTIDGKPRGALPLTSPLRLKPGPHTVRVMKDGYKSFSKEVTIKVGVTENLDAKLDPLEAAGGLRIEDAAQPGSELFVDGVLVGVAPWEGTLQPGPHVLWSRKGDTGSAPSLATVLQGQTALIRLKSTRLAPSRTISVSPDSADLKLGDVPLGKGRWIGALPPGKYIVEAAEEGYFTESRVIEVIESDDASLAITLRVDENHPRWPKRPSGKLSLGAMMMYGVGTGFHGDVSRHCNGGSCDPIAHGPIAGINVGYEFGFRLGLELAGGFMSLSSSASRKVNRDASVGTNQGVRYDLDDLLRLKGYWIGLGASYRVPFYGRWSLRPRMLGGVVVAKSSDTLRGDVVTRSGSARVSAENGSVETASTPVFVQPEIGVMASFGDWRVAGSIGLWIMLSKGPALPNGALRVSPNCPASKPTAPGCVADSKQIDGEVAFRPFSMIVPQVSLSRVF